MPLHPQPNIEMGLLLVTQPLQRSDMSRGALVTFAMDCSSTPTLAGAQDAVDDFQDAFNARLAPSFDSQVIIGQPFAKLGQGLTAPFEVVGSSVAIAGGASLSVPPPQVCALVKKTTSIGGKANRGRTYFPWFVDQSHIAENGIIDSAEVAGLQTHITNFLGDITATGTPMCIANKVFNVPLAPHYVTEINIGPLVTAYTLEPTVATQRRRVRS